MENTKHTPGPWHLGTIGSPHGKRPAIYGPRGEHVATVGDLVPLDEVKANARLLENAPALLAFAQMIAGGGINEAGEVQIEAEARELIRAATGQD